MLKISLRELFLAVSLLAVGITWWIEHRENSYLRHKNDQLAATVKSLNIAVADLLTPTDGFIPIFENESSEAAVARHLQMKATAHEEKIAAINAILAQSQPADPAGK